MSQIPQSFQIQGPVSNLLDGKSGQTESKQGVEEAELVRSEEDLAEALIKN